jgi:hypothetical protein
MPSQPSAGSRVIRTAAITLVVSILSPVHVQAAEGSEDHFAGSQIGLHEGTGEMLMTPPELGVGRVDGIDVSSHQGNVDWGHWWRNGKRFVYIKATEGTGYRNPNFTQQYTGSAAVGMIRGSYHFALPNRSDGAPASSCRTAVGGRVTAGPFLERSTSNTTRTVATHAMASALPRWWAGSAVSATPTTRSPNAGR